MIAVCVCVYTTVDERELLEKRVLDYGGHVVKIVPYFYHNQSPSLTVTSVPLFSRVLDIQY
jgi:hypothetical protein